MSRLVDAASHERRCRWPSIFVPRRASSQRSNEPSHGRARRDRHCTGSLAQMEPGFSTLCATAPRSAGVRCSSSDTANPSFCLLP